MKDVLRGPPHLKSVTVGGFLSPELTSAWLRSGPSPELSSHLLPPRRPAVTASLITSAPQPAGHKTQSHFETLKVIFCCVIFCDVNIFQHYSFPFFVAAGGGDQSLDQ